VALQSPGGETDPRRTRPASAPTGLFEERRTTRPWHLATGSLACPECDAPIALHEQPAAPADQLACPFCAHAAALRDFLSLAVPARVPRVNVFVRVPA
jgi:hypothetical protein